jgi:small GTP-binding protein
MNQKKICLLGSFCVGKTSLIRRYAYSEFSDRYLTTVGVKVDKKTLTVDKRELDLLVWDIHGEDRFQSIRPAFIRGSAGYLLVVDGTRRGTVAEALCVKEEADRILGDVPYVVILNKADLLGQWEITAEDIASLGAENVFASAKTGERVNDAFQMLASAILSKE